MTNPVQWKKFQQYSGMVVKGTEEFPPPPPTSGHVARAFWLTAKVETGAKFGSVISYDGTGMTAGLDQHIAVYPKALANEDYKAENDQGSLWKLLRQMEVVEGPPDYQHALGRLWSMLAAHGWYVSQDGCLRYVARTEVKRESFTHTADAGDLVYGFQIRDVLTPTGGVVKSEDRGGADYWALAFHELFSHPAGFKAQQHFGEEHLVLRTKLKRRWPGLTPSKSTEELVYQREVTSLKVGTNGWTDEMDLAMSVYQSNTVNAPSEANRMLYETYSRVTPENHLLFAIRLVWKLGNSTYGQWDDDKKTGRYQRTRRAAMKSGLWPKRLFEGPNAVMPADLAD